MRVLVTGASGFIGQELVMALHEAGFEVRAVMRSPWQGARLPAGVELRPADLAESETLAGLAETMDAVVHLGGATAGSWPVHRRTTASGTAAILKEAERAGVRHFLHVSSLAVYDLSRANREPIDERAPLLRPRPEIGAYARGKCLAESLARRAAQRGLPLTIVRPGLVYGPDRTALPHLGRPVFAGNLRLVVGSPKQPLPLVSVHSLVEALLAILRTDQTIGNTYQVVDDTQLSRPQYLRALTEAGRSLNARLIHLPAPLIAGVADTLAALRRVPGLHGLPAIAGRKIRDRARPVTFDNRRLQRHTAWRPADDLSHEIHGAGSTSPTQPDRPWRVGLVGAGTNSRHHLRALSRLPNVEPVGVLDPCPEAVHRLARQHPGMRAFTDAEDFYRRAHPDAIHIASPPHTHAALAMDAMQRGIHVLCEKPMASTVEECEAMAELARRHRLQLGINHNLLFDPRLQRAHRLVERGAIGRIVHVQTTAGFTPHRPAPNGITRQWVRDLSGGQLEDLAPHALYTTLAFLPDEPSLDHVGRPNRASSIDRELRLSFSGPRATAGITLSLNLRPERFTIDVHGTRGTVRLDLMNMLVHHDRLGSGPRALARGGMIARYALSQLAQTAAHVPGVLSGRTRTYGDMTGLTRRFYHCLDHGAAFDVMPRHGRTVVEHLRRIWPGSRSEDALPEPSQQDGNASAGTGTDQPPIESPWDAVSG